MADEMISDDAIQQNIEADDNPQEENIDEHLPPQEDRDPPVEEQVEQVPVESLPLDKRIQIGKNCPNPFGSLELGTWVDGLDSINQWMAATVTEIDGNMVKLHFDGWSDKWDELLRISSYKISPFRKHSVGYAGQVKVAIRRNEPSLEEYKEMIVKIDSLIDSNLKGLGAIGATQFFRGDVFVAVDNLMGRTYEPIENELFETAILLIKKTLDLINAYMKLVPSMLTQFTENTISEDLYLVDENIAIANCIQEFTEILKTIFCGNARTLRFYLKYDRAPAELKTNICKPVEERDYEAQKLKLEDLEYSEILDLINKNSELEFGLLYEFMDHFQQNGGFDVLRSSLKSIVEAKERYAYSQFTI